MKKGIDINTLPIHDFDKIKMLCYVVILLFFTIMFIAYCFRYVIANVMKHAFV